jgi:hypothetical protein
LRAHWFFAVSALAAMAISTGSAEQSYPEPSDSQMSASFRTFFSNLEETPVSEIQLATFSKQHCKPSTAVPGHYCSFVYSIAKPAKRFSILQSQGVLSGMFVLDENGQLKFEMAVG